MKNTPNETLNYIWFTDEVRFEIWYGKIGKNVIQKMIPDFLDHFGISFSFLECDDSNRAIIWHGHTLIVCHALPKLPLWF